MQDKEPKLRILTKQELAKRYSEALEEIVEEQNRRKRNS